jgi:hypothetical protein
MDQKLRDLERRWRADPTDGATKVLIDAYRRAAHDPPLELLWASPRWRRLEGLVRKWYARPLGPRDGESLNAIRAAERRLGITLPAALREWYRLVGRRLEHVQDHPIKLGDLKIDGDVLVVYGENQYVVTWGFKLTDLPHDDPPGYVADHTGAMRPWVREHETLSEMLLALTMSETVLGSWDVWERGPCGSLGWLRDGVRGAMTLSAQVEPFLRAYTPLPLPAWHWPAHPTRWFGDADTIIKIVEGHAQIETAARTAAAWERLDALVQANGGWDD